MQEADYSGYEGYGENKYFTKRKQTKAWKISLFFCKENRLKII